MFIHDETKTKFRNPVRAVPDGTTIKMSLESADICSEVFLVTIYNDTETKRHKMIMDKSADSNYLYCVDLKVKTGLYFYYFEVRINDTDQIFHVDRNIEYSKSGGYRQNSPLWQITVYDADFVTPSFLKGGTMYHIFVDRFNQVNTGETVKVRKGLFLHEDKSDVPHYKPDEKGIIHNDDVYGGNLKGITEKLDYLKSLNVTIIYLSPIFEAHSNHKYNTANYEKIDDMFGTDEDFDELIKKAGEKGIKIILDGVFNHTGDDSIYFNRYGRYESMGAYQSKESKYYDWYTFTEWNENYECWWGVKSLPSIKKDHPIFRAYICGVNGVIEKWLKRGVSGFRIDVVDELSNRMIKGINRVSKEISPENAVIGEVWEDASNKISYGERRQYLLGKQLDSVMNYPLKDAVTEYLKSRNSRVLRDTVNQIINNYPKPVLDSLMNIIGTHDTMRILTVLGMDNLNKSKDEMAVSKLSENELRIGKNLLYIASLLQFTLPGFPCIYYGDEVGMEGFIDPFNRRYYPWGNEDKEILDWYTKLSQIRADYDVFAEGEFVLIEEKNGLFCYKREYIQNDKKGSSKKCQDVYICTNLSEEDYPLDDENFKSLLSGTKISIVKKNSCDLFVKLC